MANNGGTVIGTVANLNVSQFTGTAAEVQTALRAEIDAADVIISCDTTRKKDSNDITMTVVWYEP